MAITHSVLDSGSSTTDATTRASGAVTLVPAANRVFTFTMVSHKATTPDAAASCVYSGAIPGTWALLNTVTGGNTIYRLTTYASTDAAGIGTITYDFTNTQTGFEWWVVQWDGVNDATGGSTLLTPQTVVGDNNTANDVDLHATFGSAYTAGNGVFIIAVQGNMGNSLAFEADYTPYILSSISTPNAHAGIGICNTNPSSTTVTVTTNSALGRMTAFEVRAASAGGQSVFPLMLQQNAA